MAVIPQPIRLSILGKIITVALLVTLALWMLRSMGSAISPFVGAAITAYVFNPLIRMLAQRTRVSRAVWILALYFLIGILIYWLLQSVGPHFFRQFAELRRALPGFIAELRHQMTINQVVTFGGATFDLGPIERPVMNVLTELGRVAPEMVPHIFATAIESLLLFLTYLIVTFYFLLQSDQIVEWSYRLVPAQFRQEIRSLGSQIDMILSSYIRGTLILIPIMAVLTTIVLSVLGVRYALVLGIMTGFLEVIPLLGPWSAAGIAMTVALFQATTPFGWDHWLLVVVVGISYFVLRMSEDNFIIPHVVGHAVHLHPVLVLFAILAGGALGGPFGLFISIPTVAVARLLLRYIYHKLIDSPELPPPDTLPPTPVPIPATPAARSKEVAQSLPSVQTIE